MFHMHVYYTAENAEILTAFFEEVKKAGIIEKTRREEGNKLYEYYFSAERDNEILIVEEWIDEKSQQHHDGLPHIEQLMKIKEKYGIETRVEAIG